MDKLSSHLREQVYSFAQFSLAQEKTEPQERVLGLHPGAMTTSDDFDAPLSDIFWFGE